MVGAGGAAERWAGANSGGAGVAKPRAPDFLPVMGNHGGGVERSYLIVTVEASGKRQIWMAWEDGGGFVSEEKMGRISGYGREVKEWRQSLDVAYVESHPSTHTLTKHL